MFENAIISYVRIWARAWNEQLPVRMSLVLIRVSSHIVFLCVLALKIIISSNRPGYALRRTMGFCVHRLKPGCSCLRIKFPQAPADVFLWSYSAGDPADCPEQKPCSNSRSVAIPQSVVIFAPRKQTESKIEIPEIARSPGLKAGFWPLLPR